MDDPTSIRIQRANLLGLTGLTRALHQDFRRLLKLGVFPLAVVQAVNHDVASWVLPAKACVDEVLQMRPVLRLDA